ncbi:MAG: YggS family pyridoxal phosphate-dependent enzyme [Prevotella sp.]|nr:YggS family pyridoxal phosphate-dependent enzyme [Prevotella sp.]
MGASIEKNLNKILLSLKKGVRLVAVSKFHTEEEILEAYQAGQRIFGESHERELSRKQATLPKDINWHFIGHLQTNKVKYIAPYISLIHSVDSLKLLKEIDKQAKKNSRVINVLIELHIADEATKYGMRLDECREFFSLGEWRELSSVKIIGLMMMASNTDNEDKIRKEFIEAQDFFDEIKKNYFPEDEDFKERSWGMSDDYLIAQEKGSTMVRIGTSIFGERQY